MNFNSTWTGTYNFVFDLKAIFNELRKFLQVVSMKVEAIEAFIEK